MGTAWIVLCASGAVHVFENENISATEKYLRMTAAVHPEILGQLQRVYGNMLPAADLEAAQ